MGAMTSLSNRDCVELLKGWGFEEIGMKGGHIVMQYEGRRVQLTAPGRSTPTPYKALRKAAQILRISLKDLLGGKPEPVKVKEVPLVPNIVQMPKVETPTETANEIVDVKEEAAATAPLYECSVCGKSSFTTGRGFQGHVRSHERVICNRCGKTFSRQGLGSHQAKCSPKRKAGRPRTPIAEPLAAGRRRKAKKNWGIEVPDILDHLDDDDFPSPDVFRAKTPFVGETDDRDHAALLDILFPTRDLDDLQADRFFAWVKATKALFDVL